MWWGSKVLFLLFLMSMTLFVFCASKETKGKEEEKWKKKDIRDYDDGDVERLYDQWEESEDEPLEEDEQPEWKRKPQPIDMSKLNLDDPEGVLKMTKKGKSLMMFATVAGNPTEKETESITSLWQTSLFNAHLDTQRYIVGPNRVLFMISDGSKAWDVKEFLVQQENCVEVTIDSQNYPGKGAKKKDKKDEKKKEKKTSDKSEKKSKDVKKDKQKSDNDIKKNKKSDKDKDNKHKRKEDNKTDRKNEKKTERKKTEL